MFACVRTPGHAVVNLLLIAPHAAAAPVFLGAVLPDAPIAVLYLWEGRVRGTPEDKIWSVAYQRPFWQAVIHGAHSIPLALLGALGAWLAGWHAGVLFFLSVLLHALADVPVHGEDAHRHLMPFSNWRFISPLSYWDVKRHARVVAACEAALVAVAAVLLGRRVGWLGRATLAGVVGWYVVGYWRTFLRGDGRWQPYF
jgi:hypothetical protein